MLTSFADRIALVTGAARGIGLGIARQLAVRGAAVALTDIDAEAGQEALADVLQFGGSAIFIPMDVRDEAAIRAAIERTIRELGGLNVLVNNTGQNFHYDATEMQQSEWDDALATNLRSAWLCSKYAIPQMVTQGGGVIVNIASVHANMTLYNNFPYAVTKSGLVGLTRSLALDWGHAHIRAVAVNPGYIRTQRVIDSFNQSPDPAAEEARVIELHPIKRIGTPDDVGNLVAFLASDEASFITGTEITIDGGLTARYAD
jgi:NAD(P)-dependent dehydrogenase (short-subunit alcohol dehydrogenase family)